ncbi:MAG: ABC transporter ATP-binding protein [Myxococcales bacterium]|nr:ABC transporter ATP-binding protein [Myxococcales bacterium]
MSANDTASDDIAARGDGPGRADDELGRLRAPGALAAPTRPPLRTLLRMLLADGALAPGLIALALLVSTAVAVVEAALFRGLIDVVAWIGAPEQRLGALAAVLGFMLAALAIEAPAQAGMLRLGRGIELRLRSAFRHKLPRLGERYLRSRPLSDLAERAHGIDGVRALPGLVARVVLAAGGLACTAAGLVWLDPGLWPVVAGTVAVGLCVPLLTVPLLAERDLRFRTHAGALTRYAFDALMGLSAIRTHGGQRAMRRRHEQLLTEWAGAALSLERLALWVEGALAVAGALVVGWLLFDHLRRAEDTRGVLLLVWWGLALPGRARGLVEALQAWPGARNQALRVLEPLDAPAGEAGEEAAPRADVAAGAAIELRGVALRAGTLAILEDVDLTIAPGEHVAVVGRSGAGKSSLVGLLLGLNPPSAGALRVDGEPLVGGAIGRLRSETAWVDPAVQLWNRSLLDNLRYGQAAPIDPGALLDDAELRAVLARLPEGLQTRLGEGGGLVSGGEGQRVRVARAMARAAPRLVLLDEPFRGLDRAARRRLLARTRRRWPGATLLCVTHDLDETRGFDRVVVIEDGRIIEQGPPAALVAAGGRYAALLAREAEVDAAWRDARWLHRRLDGGRVVAADEPAREAG